MIDENPNREIEYWRHRAIEYEYLYHQQKKMAEDYKKLLEELKEKHAVHSRCI